VCGPLTLGRRGQLRGSCQGQRLPRSAAGTSAGGQLGARQPTCVAFPEAACLEIARVVVAAAGLTTAVRPGAGLAAGGAGLVALGRMVAGAAALGAGLGGLTERRAVACIAGQQRGRLCRLVRGSEGAAFGSQRRCSHGSRVDAPWVGWRLPGLGGRSHQPADGRAAALQGRDGSPDRVLWPPPCCALPCRPRRQPLQPLQRRRRQQGLRCHLRRTQHTAGGVGGGGGGQIPGRRHGGGLRGLSSWHGLIGHAVPGRRSYIVIAAVLLFCRWRCGAAAGRMQPT